MSGVEPPSALPPGVSPPGASPPSASPTPDEGARLWEDHADWWQREFTDGVDPEYTEQIVPLILERLAGHDRVLDVGAGEGQVSRALAAAGAQVIGVDPIQAQVEVAAARNDAAAGNGTAVEPHDNTGPRYVRAEAAALPVASGSQDAVVACLVFEHIDDVDRAIAEVARVLRPGGRFLFLLNHPLLQTPGSGWIDDQLIDPPEQYWRIGPYLPEAVTVEEVQKDVFIRFVHRPLSRYVNALADASLPIERMDEPSPPQAFLDQSPWYAAADTVPRLLALTCVKSG
ncbi:MAG: class I SAM-dependent methyltransferase [Actinomycetota bacterium]